LDQTPSISIIVPVYTGDKNFQTCLEAVRALSPPADELLVVVDGRCEEAERLAGQFGAQVLSTATRSGPARARNLGAGAANGDILFFIDADVAMHPDAVGIVQLSCHGFQVESKLVVL